MLTAGSVAWLTISEGRNCFARSSNLFATLIGDRASFALLIALLCERSTQEGSSAAQDGSSVASCSGSQLLVVCKQVNCALLTAGSVAWLTISVASNAKNTSNLLLCLLVRRVFYVQSNKQSNCFAQATRIFGSYVTIHLLLVHRDP